MKKRVIVRSLLLVSALVAMSGAFTGCGLGGGGDNYTAEIESHLKSEFVDELKKLTGKVDELKKFLCRKGDLGKKVFSVRSFGGRMCQNKYIKGLGLLGGAALLICWDDNLDDFQGSSCAERALDDLKLKVASYSKEEIGKGMISQAEDILKDADFKASALYSTVKAVFCLLDSSLLGPGKDAHKLFCDA